MKQLIFKFLLTARYELEYLRYIVKRKRLHLLNLYLLPVEHLQSLDTQIAWKDFQIEVIKSFEKYFR